MLRTIQDLRINKVSVYAVTESLLFFKSSLPYIAMHDVTVGGHFWHIRKMAACIIRGGQDRTARLSFHGSGIKRLVVPCTVVPRILIFFFFLSSEAFDSIVVKHEWKKIMS